MGTPKETDGDDSFQSCEEDGEEYKLQQPEVDCSEIVKPNNTEKWEPVNEYPKKDSYSNLEINTGRNPAWKPDVVVTSSGWQHETNMKWNPIKYYGEPRYDMPFH